MGVYLDQAMPFRVVNLGQSLGQIEFERIVRCAVRRYSNGACESLPTSISRMPSAASARLALRSQRRNPRGRGHRQDIDRAPFCLGDIRLEQQVPGGTIEQGAANAASRT